MSVYKSFTDLELTALLKQGDQGAYTEIYERYFPLLYTHAYRKLQSEEDAKDLIQELFTVLWHRKNEVSHENLLAYLYTSIRNRVIDNYARQQVASRYVVSFQHFIDNADTNTTDYLVREKDLNRLIEAEIQALPPKMREVFELSRKGGLSHKEIAAALGISEQTVAKQVTNALKTLKTKLGIIAFIWLIVGP